MFQINGNKKESQINCETEVYTSKQQDCETHLCQLFAINFPPIKFLTEVMIHWNLHFTVIWEWWCPNHCKFILRLHHRCIDWSERASWRLFQKIHPIFFVGLGHCDICYPVFRFHLQPVFEIFLSSIIILLSPSIQRSAYNQYFFIASI